MDGDSRLSDHEPRRDRCPHLPSGARLRQVSRFRQPTAPRSNGRPEFGVRTSAVGLVLQTRSSCARLDSRGRLSPRGRCIWSRGRRRPRHMPHGLIFITIRFMADPLIIAGREFRSRLIVGTGKYKSFQETARALEASGADMVTVAVRRVNLDRSKESLLDYLDPKKYFLLPIPPDVTPPMRPSGRRGWGAKSGSPIGSSWK